MGKTEHAPTRNLKQAPAAAWNLCSRCTHLYVHLVQRHQALHTQSTIERGHSQHPTALWTRAWLARSCTTACGGNGQRPRAPRRAPPSQARTLWPAPTRVSPDIMPAMATRKKASRMNGMTRLSGRPSGSSPGSTGPGVGGPGAGAGEGGKGSSPRSAAPAAMPHSRWRCRLRAAGRGRGGGGTSSGGAPCGGGGGGGGTKEAGSERCVPVGERSA